MADGPRIPRLAPERNPTELQLSPAEGFLLSRIDGTTSWELLREIGGLAPDEVERCLERWLSEGVVVIEGGSRGEARAAEAAAPPVPEAGPEVEIDPAVDLSPELQRRILAFEAGLERPYHELLDVERDADARQIKRAYFRLSKEFHPDRYYRREIGGFGARLQRIFRKLVEAYELLSDPATRAEVQRSLEVQPPPAAAAEAASPAPAGPRAAPSERQRKLAFLERVRKRVRVPEKVLAERRFRASQLYEAGMISARRSEWREAAASIRLAIAFDPWSGDYKDGFADVQAEVHKLRAEELLEQANASFSSRAQQEALALYEEVLHYRPCDGEVLERATRLSLQAGDVERAREHAESLCEAAPERPDGWVLLGRVLRRAGLPAKAMQALQKALRIDPRNREAKATLAELRQRS